jgi:xanthine dehydrogenase accessory factor
MSTTRILVRGTGDVGSAVAHLLFRNGFGVVLHDVPRPAHTRRGMAFTNALFERKAELAGVLAKISHDIEGVAHMLACGHALPVTTAAIEAVVDAFTPAVMVDARMRKHATPEPQRHLAGITIGLGPNFAAGEQTDIAIETAWGDELGRVVRSGTTRPLSGAPRTIVGHSSDRYVYAPVAGVFITGCEIGMKVGAGQSIATIGDTVLVAPLTGRLRGLTHSEVEVAQGTKVIEIDPRDEDAGIYGIGERPRRIAQGVLEALQACA